MEDLKKIIKGTIEVDEAALKNYSHDASVFEVKPAAVIHPKDLKDLQVLVHYVTKRRQEGAEVSLTARNGGTCMSGGSLTESYVVDMRPFDKIYPIDLKNRSIKVEGGVMHLKVEEATHPHGLYFPPYTSSRDLCGIGGMIGNNASGEKSVKYGPTSSNIKKLKVLAADGELYEFGPLTPEELEEKLSKPGFEGYLYRETFKLLDENWAVVRQHPTLKKNAAGYALWEVWDKKTKTFNLARLFVGAQGTLGLVTEAELNLVPFSAFTRMIVVPIENLRDLAPTVQTMLRFDPETCETFDKHTYALAKIYHAEDAARANLAEGQHMIVFAIYAGDTQAEADLKASEAKSAIEGLGRSVSWVDDPAAIESYLLIRRKSFKLLLENPHDDSRAMPYIEDTIVPIEHYGEFLAALEVILSEYDMTYTYAGHIGDGSIRLVPLVNMETPGAAEKIMESAQRVYDLVFAFKGSMSVDHNDGLIRTPFLERMYGPEMVTLFAKVKNIFDPHGIFNPGKKVGGSLEYSKEHIVTTNK